VKRRYKEASRLDAVLRAPRREQPNIERLREALTQRAAQWKADLRPEPKVARLFLRRLVEPLTVSDPADTAAFDEWAASVEQEPWFDEWVAKWTPALLDGLYIMGTVPSGNALLPYAGFQRVSWRCPTCGLMPTAA
jgi:hypothetical protein